MFLKEDHKTEVKSSRDHELAVPVLKCLIFHDDISLFEAKTTCAHFPTGPRPRLTSRNFKSD